MKAAVRYMIDRIGRALVFFGLALMAAVFGMSQAHAVAFNVAKDVPAQAFLYLPLLKEQVHEVWPSMPSPHYFGALIEHESGCPEIKSMCWSPTARLKTSREEGAGLGQLTKAYKADGSIRFDSLAESRRLDPRGLNDLRWDTVYQRPDLQMRVVILMTRQNWNRLAPLTAKATDPSLQLKLTDVAYNAGVGRAMNDLRACGLRRGCDTGVWEGHVAEVCTASRTPIYGMRSACDIYHHHVDDVVGTRMDKYKGRV